MRRSADRLATRGGLLLVLIGLVLLLPLAAHGQEPFGPYFAPADSSAGAAADSTAAAAAAASSGRPSGGLSGLAGLASQAQAQQGMNFQPSATGPFLISFTNAPKVGTKANVRQNTYYGTWISTVVMQRGATFSNTLDWSYDEFRKQNKNVERRGEKFTYNLGQTVPLIMKLDGNWNWSRDNTVNTAGYSNLFAQQNKSLRLSGSKTKVRTGILLHSIRFGGSIDDQVSENQGTPNNSRTGTADGGLQSGWAIRPGLVLAARVSGTTGSGTKTLGAKDSPSTSFGDSLGIGIYYNQPVLDGRLAVTRSNFEKKYLDFKKNSNGLIDTVGVVEDLKVVDELETKDALSMELENNVRVFGVGFKSRLSRTTDSLDYLASGQGLKERQVDEMSLGAGVRVGVDSLAVGYDYGWKWDDQRIQNATSNRGRQYIKSRDIDFNWLRPLFRKTNFRLRYHQGLTQDIAQFEHNENDKDRLQQDFSLELERNWPLKFRTKMVYVYRQTQDLSIRDTRSSNNNIKDSYEITPSYTWTVAPWLVWDQSYRVFIQYTDYIYSDLESVSRDDNYNKRGNLTTKVTFYPTSRLEIVLRHDFNKKFNATKTATDAAGNTFYSRDLNQTISKLDLGMSFEVVDGVELEAATYRNRDDRENFGRVTSSTTDYSGEIWVGTKVSQTWRDAITLSAMVKKYNAYGPSVTETSADYWEADVWLKWEF